MWDYMYSLDMKVVLICHVDLLHATVDVNRTLPDLNHFFLYQTPVVEWMSHDSCIRKGTAALLMSPFGLGSAARFRFSPGGS